MDAIVSYTGPDFEELNYNLRYDRPLSWKQSLITQSLDETIQLQKPLTDPMIVWRGVKTSRENISHTITSFVSTSLSRDVAMTFTDDFYCLYEIVISLGSLVLLLGKNSRFPKEEEVLLPRTGYFSVTNISLLGEITLYNVIYFPTNPIDIPKVVQSPPPSDQELVERLLNIVSNDCIELFGPKEAIATVHFISLPPHIISIAIQKLTNKYEK